MYIDAATLFSYFLLNFYLCALSYSSWRRLFGSSHCWILSIQQLCSRFKI